MYNGFNLDYNSERTVKFLASKFMTLNNLVEVKQRNILTLEKLRRINEVIQLSKRKDN